MLAQTRFTIKTREKISLKAKQSFEPIKSKLQKDGVGSCQHLQNSA
jgi:hypothetical protein